MSAIVLAGARLWGAGDGGEVNVVVDGGVVTSIVPHGAELPRTVRRIDLAGRWLMPGLVDHHVHFTLWAKHRARLSVAGIGSAAEVARVVREALHAADAAPGLTLVGRGFQDALWPDAPSAAALDEAAARAGRPDAAIVLLSHDLHAVWLNTVAAARWAAAPGLVREDEAFAVQVAIEAEEAADAGRVDALVADAVRAASARGVTGVLDLEMADNPSVWERRVQRGVTALRVRAGVYPAHLEAAIARGERTGTVVAGTEGLVTVGPLKVFADGSLNTRTAWCFDPYPEPHGGHGHAAHAEGELAAILADARERGFEVALHAIGDRAVAEALDAFEVSGARGSIEHAQLVRERDAGRFALLSVAAGIHPQHLLDDRPVADALWRGRTGRAFAYAALAAAGAELRMGSDAPVSPLDPWLGVGAAVHRTRGDDAAWEPQQALSVEQALAASWAMPAIVPGAAADMVALDADPSAMGPAALREMPVALTMVAGTLTHEAL